MQRTLDVVNPLLIPAKTRKFDVFSVKIRMTCVQPPRGHEVEDHKHVLGVILIVLEIETCCHSVQDQLRNVRTYPRLCISPR